MQSAKKTMSMKTVKIQTTNTRSDKRQLFRKLFLLQTALVNELNTHDSAYDQELEEVIHSIDGLLEAMLSDPT